MLVDSTATLFFRLSYTQQEGSTKQHVCYEWCRIIFCSSFLCFFLLFLDLKIFCNIKIYHSPYNVQSGLSANMKVVLKPIEFKLDWPLCNKFVR